MRSCLYDAAVVHRRLTPVLHEFRYDLGVFLLDLDELDELDRRFRLFGVNRSRPLAFRDKDHLDDSPGTTRERITRYLAAHAIDVADGSITLLTQCRVFGYVFNPVCFFYAYDRKGALVAVVAEVTSTFGERLLYLLDDPEPGRRGRQCFRRAKALHVSPFIGMEADYAFEIGSPGERLFVGITETKHGEHFFDAHLFGKRRVLDERSLARFLVRYPMLTLSIVGGIHFEALRLWIKGAPFHRQPPPTPAQREQQRLLAELAEHGGNP